MQVTKAIFYLNCKYFRYELRLNPRQLENNSKEAVVLLVV